MHNFTSSSLKILYLVIHGFLFPQPRRRRTNQSDILSTFLIFKSSEATLAVHLSGLAMWGRPSQALDPVAVVFVITLIGISMMLISFGITFSWSSSSSSLPVEVFPGAQRTQPPERSGRWSKSPLLPLSCFSFFLQLFLNRQQGTEKGGGAVQEWNRAMESNSF